MVLFSNQPQQYRELEFTKPFGIKRIETDKNGFKMLFYLLMKIIISINVIQQLLR